MYRNLAPLIALTIGCTFAAVVFGFGSEMFAFRSSYGGLGKEPLILLTRLFVYLALAAILVFKGGWRGVAAAIVMVVCATTIEWALFPFAYDWASISNPTGYAKKFGAGGVDRPAYGAWATFDIMSISLAAAFTQGLRMMAHVNPQSTPDE